MSTNLCANTFSRYIINAVHGYYLGKRFPSITEMDQSFHHVRYRYILYIIIGLVIWRFINYQTDKNTVLYQRAMEWKKRRMDNILISLKNLNNRFILSWFEGVKPSSTSIMNVVCSCLTTECLSPESTIGLQIALPLIIKTFMNWLCKGATTVRMTTFSRLLKKKQLQILKSFDLKKLQMIGRQWQFCSMKPITNQPFSYKIIWYP